MELALRRSFFQYPLYVRARPAGTDRDGGRALYAGSVAETECRARSLGARPCHGIRFLGQQHKVYGIFRLYAFNSLKVAALLLSLL